MREKLTHLTRPIEGTWEMIRAEQQGEDSPELIALGVELEIHGGSYLVRFAGQVADRGTFTEDPACDPKVLMLFGAEGPNAGRTIPCIYQLAGNRLRVCYGLDRVPPTVFAT